MFRLKNSTHIAPQPGPQSSGPTIIVIQHPQPHPQPQPTAAAVAASSTLKPRPTGSAGHSSSPSVTVSVTPSANGGAPSITYTMNETKVTKYHQKEEEQHHREEQHLTQQEQNLEVLQSQRQNVLIPRIEPQLGRPSCVRSPDDTFCETVESYPKYVWFVWDNCKANNIMSTIEQERDQRRADNFANSVCRVFRPEGDGWANIADRGQHPRRGGVSQAAAYDLPADGEESSQPMDLCGERGGIHPGRDGRSVRVSFFPNLACGGRLLTHRCCFVVVYNLKETRQSVRLPRPELATRHVLALQAKVFVQTIVGLASDGEANLFGFV